MSAIPIVRATTCPTVAELGDKENAWAIVFAVNGRSYVGRVDDLEAGADAVVLSCPFDYFSKRELAGDARAPRLGMHRQIFPIEHFAIDSIVVRVATVIALHMLTPRALESFREDLVSAWEGREHLLKHGGKLDVAPKSTIITAP